MPGPAAFDTHTVTNQSPPLADIDLFAIDRPLQDAVRANDGEADSLSLSAFGRRWGAADMFDLGRLANENPPKLRTHDARGRRKDMVEFHPAYHSLMAASTAAGLHASTWRADGTRAPPPSEVVRAARFYMAAQVETGHLCPVTMTRAAVAPLAAAPGLRDALLPRLLSTDYDPTFRPWFDKTGLTLGMGMTEKQGGTDVRANTTIAKPCADAYAITGHKWFMSAPMCDAFLVLAQAPGGLTCFLMPRFRPDGAVNGLRLQRLKDKLGNRSNASSEVEFVDAFAWRVGAEGRGVRTIIDMVQLTRLDCAIASAGLMRMALAQAVHHTRHRRAFGRPLGEQPLMRAVLADLALELEGAVAMAMRLCRSFDLAASDAREAARARLLTPVVKFWVCKSAPAFIYEAMECLGGNGYVEESMLPRLYREAPVNAIWEGSGNVMCLDVLRAFSREPEASRAVLRDLVEDSHGAPEALRLAGAIEATLASQQAEAQARNAVENLARLTALASLAGSAPAEVAEAFLLARINQRHGPMFGVMPFVPASANVLLDRVLPI